MKKLLKLIYCLVLVVSIVWCSACNPTPDEPQGPPPEEVVFLEVMLKDKPIEQRRVNYETWDVGYIQVKTSKTEGWWLEYRGSNPSQFSVTDEGNIIFQAPGHYLVEVIYTNGINSITKSVYIYASHITPVPMDLFLTQEEVNNGYNAKDKWVVDTDEVVELTPIVWLASKLHSDVDILSATIEDESIVKFEDNKFIPLKKGTTKVVIEAGWRTYRYNSYTNNNHGVGLNGQKGSENLRREITITVK